MNPQALSAKASKAELFTRGIFIGRMTPPRKIQRLISCLWPIQTDLEMCRLGGEGDGGYLIPNDLDGITACFSPGVADIAHFESELFRTYGIPSHLADASVDGPPEGFTPKSFTKKFLGGVDHQETMTLGHWIELAEEKSGDLLLQMDIEGGEYATILAASQSDLARFRIIALEIHDVESWGEPRFFSLVETFFEKLTDLFYVVHNHPNNCCSVVNLGGVVAPQVFELTLIRKDRVRPKGYAQQFPHPLDRSNLPSAEDLPLPANWFYRRARLTLPPPIPIDWHFLKDLHGVIHVGGNQGDERQIYQRFGLCVLWVEPIPDVFKQLSDNIRYLPLQTARKALVVETSGTDHRFHIASNNGASSSIFEMKMHHDIWPDIHYTSAIEITGTSLDDLLDKERVGEGLYDGLVIDTQGSELAVLKGAGSLLPHLKWIKLEASDFESYQGAALLDEISMFLESRSFIETSRFEIARHPSGGRYYDVLFQRRRTP